MKTNGGTSSQEFIKLTRFTMSMSNSMQKLSKHDQQQVAPKQTPIPVTGG
jgi:hypothetical protein